MASEIGGVNLSIISAPEGIGGHSLSIISAPEGVGGVSLMVITSEALPIHRVFPVPPDCRQLQSQTGKRVFPGLI